MKTIIISFLSLIFIIACKYEVASQNEVKIILTENDLNNVMKVIKDARGLNFGEYIGGHGLNAWYLNMENAQFDIKSNNVININNLKLKGGVDLRLWLFDLTPTGEIAGTIHGTVNIVGNNIDGFSLHVIPNITSLNYSGSLQSVVNLITFFMDDFSNYIPKIELNLGYSLLPNLFLEYFDSGMPNITTNEEQIALTFHVLFEDLIVRNKIINPGENIVYTASNSIILKENFIAKEGSNFSAFITPKNTNTLKSIMVNDKQVNEIQEDTIPLYNKTCNIDQKRSNNNDNNLDVFPNPFMHNVFINNPLKNNFTIVIMDLQGKIVFESANVKDHNELDLSHLTQGMYILNFIIDHNIERKKIIKQ